MWAERGGGDPDRTTFAFGRICGSSSSAGEVRGGAEARRGGRRTRERKKGTAAVWGGGAESAGWKGAENEGPRQPNQNHNAENKQTKKDWATSAQSKSSSTKQNNYL